MTTSHQPAPATACWCRTLPLEPDVVEDQPPIEDRELATLEEIARLETERVHAACALPPERLAPLALVLAAPARDAYVTARLNGLCEDGATELFRDTLAAELTRPR